MCVCVSGACGACSDDESVKATKQVLDELGMTSVSLTDLQHVRRICHVLSHRAACLVAAGRLYMSTDRPVQLFLLQHSCDLRIFLTLLLA